MSSRRKIVLTDATSKRPEPDLPDDRSDATKSDWLRWRYWPVLGGTVSVLTLLVGAAGLWLVLFELQHSLEHRKADVTLEFVERFNSDVYVTARNDVLKPWLKYQAQLVLANEYGGMSKEKADRLTSLIIQQDREAGGNLETQVLTLINFFDELAICVESEICDLVTSCLYFQKRAQDLNSLYGPAIAILGSTFDLNYFGSGLRTISELETCPHS